MSKEIEELLEFLWSSEYSFKDKWIDKNTEGFIDFNKEVVAINVSILIVEVFVHEWLHYKYPELNEEAIVKKTEKVILRLKVSEIKLLAEEILKEIKN